MSVVARRLTGMDAPPRHLWHDPRTCSADQFGGPLPLQIAPESADHLEDLCRAVGSHTLLSPPVVEPALAWSGPHALVQLRPDHAGGFVDVLAGGHVLRVGTRALRPIELGRAIIDSLLLEPSPVDPLADRQVVHHFCGTSSVMLRSQYGNPADHPLTGEEATTRFHGDWFEEDDDE